jgi:peptidoglycan/xylan/chitin deacetylase (PgdA/CDA1 family)
VALTFDDGPDPKWTPQVLAALDAPATFFALGEQVRRHPGTARDALRAGHEIACHGDRHAKLVRQGPRATFRDLADAHEAIADATGRAPAFFRPPHGVLTGPALLAARRLGMRPALWSASAGDWQPNATADSICRKVLAAARPGAVFLLHDAGGWPDRPAATVAALPDLLRGLRRQGLEPVTLGELWEVAA